MAENLSDELLSREINSLLYAKYLMIGMARMALHDKPGAREALLRAKAFAESMVKQVGEPRNADGHAKLGEALALLGEKEAAISHATRATELLPQSKDASYGPVVAETLARVYATVGEPERAIDILDGLLARPTLVTVALLELQPAWDSLRNHPRFVALLKRDSRDG